MNERIKELAKQVGAQGIVNIDFINIEKFAELIVQECLDIVESEDDCGPDTKSVRLAMLRIKQHFGIES
jgi:hypothetical protein